MLHNRITSGLLQNRFWTLIERYEVSNCFLVYIWKLGNQLQSEFRANDLKNSAAILTKLNSNSRKQNDDLELADGKGGGISRIHWCKGLWYGSTYMAVRLSAISSKTGQKCIFCVFWPFSSLCQTASRLYRLSHTNALRINESY